MAQSITRLMNDVRTRLPGVTDALIQQELFSTMDAFFKGSDVWQNVLSVPIQANITSYDLEPDDPNALINRVITTMNSNAQPVSASMQVVGTLVLDLTPSTSDTLAVTVALTVSDPVPKSTNIPQCPDWIADKYRDSLTDGVISRLCAMTAKPFANEKLAIFHGRKFMNGVNLARREARQRNVLGAQSWAFPTGFAAGKQRYGRSW